MIKILLVHFKSSIALDANLLTEKPFPLSHVHPESSSAAGIACFVWL
jgi:hypothetical protein